MKVLLSVIKIDKKKHSLGLSQGEEGERKGQRLKKKREGRIRKGRGSVSLRKMEKERGYAFRIQSTGSLVTSTVSKLGNHPSPHLLKARSLLIS